MARSQFGGTYQDWLMIRQGNLLALKTGTATLTFWSTWTGSGTPSGQYTDLLDQNNNPVSSIIVNGYQIPRFSGPDNVAGMWAWDGTGIDLFWMEARNPDFTGISGKVDKGTLAFYVKDYGAAVGTSDSTAAIQAAIDAANAAGGGRVVGAGGRGTNVFSVSTLKMRSYVSLEDISLKLRNTTNGNVIELFNARQEQVGLRNVYVDGNKANQTAGHGIYFLNDSLTNGVFASGLLNPHHFVDNLIIQNCKQDGLNMAGDSLGGENHISNVFSYANDRYGFYSLAPDSNWDRCVAGQSGVQGFYLESPNTRYNNCKSWFSGRIDSSNGDGFFLTAGMRQELTGCESQDNKRHGFVLFNTKYATLTGCVADSNNWTVAGAGFRLDGAQSCYVSGVAYDKQTPTPTQKYHLVFAGTTVGNIIDLACGPFASGGANINGTIGNNTVRVVSTTGSTVNPSTDVQVFTASGTWTKPTGAVSTTLIGVGGGSGGGSGRRGAAASVRTGGGGGGGGARSFRTVPSSALGATETVTIGLGGAGGAAVTANDTNGNAGSAGGQTTFGSWLRCVAPGVGAGGSTGAASGGGGGAGTSAGGGGGTSSGTGGVGTASSNISDGAGGGGSGGGITSADAVSNGGLGQGPSDNTFSNGAAGTSPGGAGGAGGDSAVNSGVAVAGGGGGASSITGAAGAGGVGGRYGGGGGGGGASLNGNNSGAGGNGADGICIAITQCA